jgi:fibronectin-binding autotransporter adhesin
MSNFLIGADRIWTGASNNQFSNSSNWQGNTAPTTLDTAVFSLSQGGTVSTPTNSSAVNGLRFQAAAGAFTLGLTNTETLSIVPGSGPGFGFIEKNSTADQTIQAQLNAVDNMRVNSNTSNSTIKFNGGIRQFDAASNFGTSNTLTFDGPGNSLVQNGIVNNGAKPFSLVKQGSGTLTIDSLTGTTSSYNGTVSFNAGTVAIIGNQGTNTSLGTGAVAVNSARLDLIANANSTYSPTQLNISGTAQIVVDTLINTVPVAPQVRSFTNLSVGNDTLAVNRGSVLSSHANSTNANLVGVLSASNTNIVGSSTKATFDVGPQAVLQPGLVTSSNATISKQGSGLLNLSQNTGVAKIEIAAGTVRTINSGALTSNHHTDIEFISSSGAKFFTLTASASIGALSATSSANARVDSLTSGHLLTIGSGNESSVYSGLIQTGLSIEKVGSGTLTLGGNNSYTGTTTVSGGTLTINGNQSSAFGTVTVGAQAILAGIGVVGGATVFESGSQHSPGSSPGIQSFSSHVIHQAGSTLNWELIGNDSSSRGTLFDGVNVAGTLTVDSGASSNLIFNSNGSTVRWSDSFWNSDQQWLVYDANSLGTSNIFGVVNVGPDSIGNSLGGQGTFSWNAQGNDVFLKYTVTAVPEPSSLILALGAATAILKLRRHKIAKRPL